MEMIFLFISVVLIKLFTSIEMHFRMRLTSLWFAIHYNQLVLHLSQPTTPLRGSTLPFLCVEELFRNKIGIFNIFKIIATGSGADER